MNPRSISKHPLSSNELRGQARDIVAERVGVSPTTFQRALVIIEKVQHSQVKKKRKKRKKPNKYFFSVVVAVATTRKIMRL